MVLLKLKDEKAIYELYLTSTFHYGSIKMLHHLLIVGESGSSTFHYGSIKITNAVNSYAMFN